MEQEEKVVLVKEFSETEETKESWHWPKPKWKYKKTFLVALVAFGFVLYNTISSQGSGALKSYNSYVLGVFVWLCVFIVIWRFFVSMVILFQVKRESENLDEMKKVKKFHEDYDFMNINVQKRIKKEFSESKKNRKKEEE